MSYISIDYMRNKILKRYPGSSWRQKVMSMPDNQIMAIYYSKQDNDISDLEMSFFRNCYVLTYGNRLSPREVTNMLYTSEHTKKICKKLLKKWSELGFYDYGETLDLGWFYKNKMPKRYLKIIKDINF